MPRDLPVDAERVLSRRCAKQGVKELAVPLGDGWMQRAGRGSFGVVEESSAKGGEVMYIESLEPNFYLLTYDQTPDAHVTKSGLYRIEASVRCLPGATIKEQPYAALVINWQRGRSTVTAPCFTALVLTPGAWRIDQYCDGSQTTLAEVRDSTLKAGGSFHRLTIDVRADKISVHANKRSVFGSFTIPPVTDGSLAGGRGRAASLTGPCGIAVYRSRAQLRCLELSPLDAEEGEGMLSARPAFTGVRREGPEACGLSPVPWLISPPCLTARTASRAARRVVAGCPLSSHECGRAPPSRREIPG